MSKKIYAGNLNYATTEETLENLFSKFGQVISSTIIRDSATNLSKGFGFIEMEDDNADLLLRAYLKEKLTAGAFG